MFILHAIIVLTGNIMHVWLHKQHNALVSLYYTSSLINDGYGFQTMNMSC